MNAVKHFLGSYSDNFAAALVLWPVLSFMFTLPILAYLYHRDGRLRFGTFVGAYLTVLYVCGLGCFTLYPLPQGDAGLGITYGVAPNFNPMNFMNDIAKDGLKAVFQLAFNVVFFMPLGFIAGRLLRLRFLPSVLLGLAASLLIEVSQLTGLFGIYPYAYRCCDVDDVITNTLGAALGWVCAWLLGRVVPPGQLADAEPTEHPGFVRRCVALWIDLVIVWLVAVVPYGVVAVAFQVIGVLFNGWSFLLLTCVGYIPGFFIYVKARKDYGNAITMGEKVCMGVISALGVLSLVLLAMGVISI